MSRPNPPLDPVLDFMRLLWAIEHRLQSTSKRMEARLGVTGPQRLVLRVAGRFPGLAAGELARILQLHPSTLTGIIQRLIDKRLLVRRRDARDGRVTRLYVSGKGARFMRASPETIEAAVARALARVPAAGVRRARAVLRSIADALERQPRS
jgi:DNA-binding MarR family transcriptional regulator